VNLCPFQEQGVKSLISRSSVLLGDEMGLGKTVQVATALKVLFESGAIRRVLVVCPTSLFFNWRYEIARWANGLRVLHVVQQAQYTQKCVGWPIIVAVSFYLN